MSGVLITVTVNCSLAPFPNSCFRDLYQILKQFKLRQNEEKSRFTKMSTCCHGRGHCFDALIHSLLHGFPSMYCGLRSGDMPARSSCSSRGGR